MEQLNKDKLDQMPLEVQIKYINNELKTGGASLTKICKAIGIGRSTVAQRAKSKGFVFDKGLNQYVKIDKVTDIIKTTTPTATKVQDGKIQEIVKEQKSDIVFNSVGVIPSNSSVAQVEYNEINGQKMDYILSKLDTLEEMIKIFEAKKESIGLGNNDIIIDLIDDRHLDPKPRSMRINSFVLKEWDKFCNENRYYQKMDLVSMALKEYIENHRK